MLRRLRLAHRDRILWVDAICIDQSNTLEKDSQVAMMGRIYNRARRVIIDIGEASDTSHEALTHLKALAYIVIDCQQDVLHSFRSGMRMKEVINKLYERPWFSRIWVLQEAFMSQDAVVMCGTQMVPWWYFRSLRIWIDSRPARETEPWHAGLPEDIPRALTMGGVASHGKYIARQDLLRMLCQSRTCMATDPRDKVFALLDMMDEIPRDLTPVYAEGNTALKVYVSTAGYLLNTSGLAFLSAVHRVDWPKYTPVEGLPSWVPDWALPIGENWTIGLRTFAMLSSSLTGDAEATSLVYSPLSAGGSTKACAQVVDSVRLQVRGLLVDKIRRTTKEGTSLMDDNPHPLIPRGQQHGRNFVSECFQYRAQRPSPPPLPRPKPWQPRTAESRIHPPEWLSKDLGLPVSDPLRFNDNGLSELWPPFLIGVRQLVLSDKGYIGLAPRGVREGDLICCFTGANVPFILRQPNLSVGEFVLVGEAYIYGLMEGEAFDGVDWTSCSNITDDPKEPLVDFVIV